MIAGGGALAASIAASRFRVEARDAGLEDEVAQQEHERAVLLRNVPSHVVGRVDPTRIGVDPAQSILPGGEVLDYVARAAHAELLDAVETALEGSGRWLVVVIGPSKVGKSPGGV